MDTIRFRLPLLKVREIKINKARLAKILIATELLGILVMIWYLRVPLYRKFLAVKPKAFSVHSFQPQTRYQLSQNDFLLGTAAPGYKVKLLFTAGKYKRTVKVSEQGNWVAQIPKNMALKNYRLTVAQFDTSDKLALVESYKVQVQSENFFKQSNLYKYYLKPFFPKSALAAAPKIKFTPTPAASPTIDVKPALLGMSPPPQWSKQFISWVSQAQALGVYPYCETNGEVDSVCSEDSDIVLTSYSSYANICQQSFSCYISDSASTLVSHKIDPVAAQSIIRGEPVSYAAVLPVLQNHLSAAPSYTAISQQLISVVPDDLSRDEQAILDQQDGYLPRFKPYVEINSKPETN